MGAWPLAWLLVGFAVRVHALEVPSLWLDEAISAWMSHQALPVLVTVLRSVELHPPGYYLLLHGWIHLTGYSEFSLRYLSLLAGMLVPPLLYACGRRLSHASVGTAALALGALLPPLVLYSREARPYSLLALLGALGLLAVLRADAAPSGSRLRWSTLLPVAAAYTHYFGLFLMAGLTALLAALLWVRRASRPLVRQLGLPLLMQAVLMVPLALLLLLQLPTVRGFAHRSEAPLAVPDLLRMLWAFVTVGDVDFWRASPLSDALGQAWLLVLLVSLAMLLRTSRIRSLSLLVSYVILLAVPVLLASRYLPGSLLHPRHVIWIVVPVALLASLAAAAAGPLRWLRMGTVMAGVLVLSSLVLYPRASQPVLGRDEAREVAAQLSSSAGKGDLVLSPLADMALHYYYRGEPPLVQLAMRWTEVKRPPSLPEREMWQPPATLVWEGDLATAAWVRDGAGAGGSVYLPVWLPYFRAIKPVEFVLESLGSLKERRDFRGYRLDRYLLDPGAGIELRPWPQVLRVGPLDLTGVRMGAVSGEGEPFTLALDWLARETTGETLRMAVTFLDPHGRSLARYDETISDELGMSSPFWSAGHRLTSHHVLVLPTGMPPGDHGVMLEVYRERDLAILQVVEAQGGVVGGQIGLGTTRFQLSLIHI